MSERTVVHLLRHGEVDNPAKVLYGRLPGYHLSELGAKMAELAAQYLAGRDVRAVIASPLERAQETAAPIAARFGLEVGSDDRLIEAGERVRGADGRRRRRQPAPPAVLVAPAQPAAAVVGRAVHPGRRPDARRRRGRPGRGTRPRGGARQPPAADLDRPAVGRRAVGSGTIPRRRQCSLASVTALEYDDERLVAVVYSEPAAHLLPGASTGGGGVSRPVGRVERGRRARAVAGLSAVALSSLLLAGCSSGGGSAAGSGISFVSGDGTITYVAVKDRPQPVDLSGTTLDGAHLDVASYRGKLVVVNVWGSWCSPCRAEAPALQAAYQQLGPTGVAFVGIDTADDDPAQAKAFVQRFGVSYPSIVDEGGAVLLSLRGAASPKSVPTTLILDRAGTGGCPGQRCRRPHHPARAGRRRAHRSDAEGGHVIGGVQATILDGSLLAALPIAVAAGAVSFLSPCVLPLVPGYLGYVTGLTGVDLANQRRGRMLAGIGLFVLGFTAVYVTIGATAGAVGGALQRHQAGLTQVLGVVTIVLGLVYLGALPVLQSAARPDVRPVAGLAGAPLLGAVFALGWTACTGPTLGAILALAGVGGSALRGALLATAYCFGLGLPFLFAGLAYRRAMGAFAAVRRHSVIVSRIGGVMLVLVGVLLVTGVWTQLMNDLRGSISGFETVI